MKTIYVDRFVVELPAGAEFLSVQMQRGEPRLLRERAWAPLTVTYGDLRRARAALKGQ